MPKNTTTKIKCNKDCFNCPYEDCILPDNLPKTHGKYKDLEKRKAYMREYFKKNGYKYAEKRRAYQQQYYLQHREEIIARAKEHYRRKNEQSTLDNNTDTIPVSK